MALASLNNLAANQNRSASGSRPAARPGYPTATRLGADATRLKPAAQSTALPAAPARFTSPEDFKAYVGLLSNAIQALKAQAAGPRAALDAAETALQQKDAEIGTGIHLARAGLASVKCGAGQDAAGLATQIEQAKQALDAARHPGRANANRLRREMAGLEQRIADEQANITHQQALLDGGQVQGKARAEAYAQIAISQHAIGRARTQLEAKSHEHAAEFARTAPDYDPLVSAAKTRLSDLEQQRDRGKSDADARLAQWKTRVEQTERDYDQQMAPYRQDVEAAKKAYAPAKAALDAARQRLVLADANVTKTQRALWWARGFNLQQFMAEQVAAAN